MTHASARPEAAELLITFLYYHDVPRAQAFYEHILGAELAIDQGWSKIYRLTGAAHIGLVDQSRGAKRASGQKPVQICLRVPDVDAWHAWAAGQGAEMHPANLTAPKDSAALGIRAFTFDDPEGYQIEIQSAL